MNDPLDQLRLRFTGLQLWTETTHGTVYVGRDFTGVDVTVSVLGPQAAADPGLRSAFADAVSRHSAGSPYAPGAVHAADLNAAHPWAATRGPAGQPGAEQLLAALGGPASLPTIPPPPGAWGAPQPAPGAWGPPQAPAGWGPPPASPGPPRSGSPWPWLIGVAASVVVLVVVVVAAVVAVQLLGGDEEEPTAGPEPTGRPPAQTGPPESGPPSGSGEPALREDVEPLSVIGPTWEPGDETYTMAFDGWPFAFRTPPDWNCLAGSYDPIPEAPAWFCTNPDPDAEQMVNVMLWECPTTCTEDEQAQMIEDWLDEPERAVRSDELPVAYVETEENDRGRYSVDLSYFAGDPGQDGPLRWHIGVFVESPYDTREDVLRPLNDIITQAS